MKYFIFIYISIVLLMVGCGGKPDLTHKYYDIKECKEEMSLADDIDESERIDMIIVYKSKREMELYRDGEVVKTLPVSLGKNPKGNKIMSGDNHYLLSLFQLLYYLC